MQLTCTNCGARMSLETALNDIEARKALAAALSMPAQLGDRTLRYIGLFRPQQRSLTWPRFHKLLNELLAQIKDRSVTRNGITWSAPLETWEMALDQIMDNRDTLRLPLKSHGYLFEIVAGIANRAAGVQERKTEKEKISRAQQRGQQPDQQPEHKPFQASPALQKHGGPVKASTLLDGMGQRVQPPESYNELKKKIGGKKHDQSTGKPER